MSKVVILCDERDASIAESVREALGRRGKAAVIVACDAAAETIGDAARERLSAAAVIVVVVREGGRGNRLLRSVEDEAPPGARVLSLVADASPDAAVSARTQARIDTVRDATLAALGGGPSPARRTWPRIAAVLVAVALLAGLFWLFFRPAHPSPESGPRVMLTGTLSNAGWVVTFHLREEASTLEYKLPDSPAFVSTGDAGPGAGPTLGQRHAKMYAILGSLHGAVPFLVRYSTMDGDPMGPYEVVFDTTAESVASVKRNLEDIPAWLGFRLQGDRWLCYFTTLLTYKYALRSIRYGVDTAVPDRAVTFLASDVPGIQDGDQLYVELPGGASSVTVELTFLDGTRLGPKRFQVR